MYREASFHPEVAASFPEDSGAGCGLTGPLAADAPDPSISFPAQA